ncbi:hypothetical protein Dda_3355 [Drechslerella dactyloides]|uniref:Uncharacterized protein n=1 Tax=Drechslerella dactyloides TaxID=74499 RepID=A0AAD6J149_DREDA|nr:hypothetical protein Dda_3355 [Drechslerella dactyloides]
MVTPASVPLESGDRLNVQSHGAVFKGDAHESIVPGPHSQAVQILDIRTSIVEETLSGAIIEGLEAEFGKKTLPTMLLYDSAGLKIFEEITYVEDYYLTNAEIEVLTTNATEIAATVPNGAVVVELGSGNLRKVNILLQALEAAQKIISYFALDLSRPELERTFSQLPNGGFRYVQCFGLHGTYDDGMKWLKENEAVKDRPRFVLWLGSSIGNFERKEAEVFLRNFKDQVLRPGTKDRMLIAFDACTDIERVYYAYNDRQGVTARFILNGLNNANSIMGHKIFDIKEWEYRGEFDLLNQRHQAFYVAKKDITLTLEEPAFVKQGEKILVERSYKFLDSQATIMFENSGLAKGTSWGQEGGEYGKASVLPEVFAKSPCPTVEDWEALWKTWDAVTLSMVRPDQYLVKPIDLRNPIIFYLGHIPTFLDVQLARAMGSSVTGPKSYPSIFQRGIDPDVDDPSKCHAHSDIPEAWPALEDIKQFQLRLREKVRSLYREAAVMPVNVQRAIWLGFEHEIMHLETLLYMLLQHELTLPPPGVPAPDFRAEYTLDSTKPSEGETWMQISGRNVTLGTEDHEEDGGYFTWDNEKPSIQKSVASFEAFSRPITNGEYAVYLHAINSKEFPKSWSLDGRNALTDTISKVDESIAVPEAFKGLFVKTVFGPVPLTYAQHWPVIASYDELNGCAKWMGGRLPTREELQVIYDHVEVVKKGMEQKKLAAMIAAVNGHLSMDGVHITPPEPAALAQAENMSETNDMFANLLGANVSFYQWHPTCVWGKVCGRGDGGAWEWTSTMLEKWEGFKPMELYPEYTADFFDTKHNIVMGGSWATYSRVAGRKTFVNWYQRNYQYSWCTGRLVRDTPVDKSA